MFSWFEGLDPSTSSKEDKIVTDPFDRQRKEKKFCAIAELSSSLKVGFAGFVCTAHFALPSSSQCIAEIEQKSQ